MKTFAKTISMLLILLLAFSCSKEETILPAGDESPDVLKKATVIDDEIYLCGKMLFDVVAPKMNENKVVISSDWMWLYMYAKITPDPDRKGYYTLLTREWMPSQDAEGNPILNDEGEQFPMFEFRVVEFNARITPGGAVQFFWPGTDKWWEFMGVPFNDVIEQVIAHTGVDVKGPGVNKRTIMYQGYFKGGVFEAGCHLSGLQVQEPAMEVYAGLEGPVQLNFTMEMEVCEYSDFPWEIDLPL